MHILPTHRRCPGIPGLSSSGIYCVGSLIALELMNAANAANHDSPLLDRRVALLERRAEISRPVARRFWPNLGTRLNTRTEIVHVPRQAKDRSVSIPADGYDRNGLRGSSLFLSGESTPHSV